LLARSVTLNVLGQVGSLVVGFVSSILLARWLGPSDRGLLGVIASFATLAFMVAGLGIPMSVLYHASRDDRRVGALAGNSFLCAALLGVVLAPLTWLLRHPLADLFSQGRGADEWALAAVLVPLSFLDYATQNLLIGRLRFGYFNALGVLARVVGLAATATLVVALGYGVAGGLLAAAAGSLFMVFSALRVALRGTRLSLDRELLRSMASYGSRVQVGAIFQMLNYRLDVIIVQFFAPLRIVGLYVVAQVIAELSNLVSSAFQNSVLPLVARAGADDRADTTATGIRHHGIVVLFAIVGVAIFGPLVISIGYGSAYHGAIVPMLILLPGMWFLGTALVIGSDLRGRGRPGLSSILSCVALVVTIALDAALIPPFGIVGAAVASVGAYTVYGIASVVVISRFSGRSVRDLIVPTRDDFRAYPAAVRALLARRAAAASPPAPDQP
jgi:O-antigen/teichoic acid export membrane protein